MRKSLVESLRARGLDVTTAYEAGMIGRDDHEHLDYATETGRVLFSFNRGDFYRIHTEYLEQNKSHAGSFWPISRNIQLGSKCGGSCAYLRRKRLTR